VASEPVTLITWLGSLGVNLGADQWPILSDRRLRRDGFASSSARLTRHVLGSEMSMRCRTAAGTLP